MAGEVDETSKVNITLEVTVPKLFEKKVIDLAKMFIHLGGDEATDDVGLQEAIEYLFNDSDGIKGAEIEGVQWFTVTNTKEEA